MGLFTYSKKQSDKIIARAFIDFLGGSKAISNATQSNADTLRFLKEKDFFNDEGLGSIEALNEKSKTELAALFRSGVKYNDFNDFFTFASRFNPMFSVGKDFEEIYLDRYNDVFDKALINERERKNQPIPEFGDIDRVSIINRREILKSFGTPIISEGIMGKVLKGNYGTTTKDAVALLTSASKVLDFYHENDKAVEHYRKIIQACMFENNYKMVEKIIDSDPIDKPSSHNERTGNHYGFVGSIFNNLKDEMMKTPFFATRKTKTETLKEPQKVQIKEKLEGKTIKESVLTELKEMGVNVNSLQESLTKDNMVKFYLANKNKASIEDIKDIIRAEESVKTLVLEPIFNFFLGTKNSKKFDPELLTQSQMKLLHNLSNFEENDISVVIRRVENQSQIVKNLFERTFTKSKSDEKIKKEILNTIISSRILAIDDYQDFVSALTSLFFEPQIKTLISSKQTKMEINVPKNGNKTFVPGFVRVSGEVLFIENLPISFTKDQKTGKYEVTKLDFSKAELERFKSDLWTEYGCDAQAVDLEKDFYLGNNKYLLEIVNISNENAAEIMSRINNSDRTKEFIKSKRVFSDNELKEICGQVKVKNADYSIFKSEAFYKNAKQAAYDKALKSFSKQQQAEKEQAKKEEKEKLRKKQAESQSEKSNEARKQKQPSGTPVNESKEEKPREQQAEKTPIEETEEKKQTKKAQSNKSKKPSAQSPQTKKSNVEQPQLEKTNVEQPQSKKPSTQPPQDKASTQSSQPNKPEEKKSTESQTQSPLPQDEASTQSFQEGIFEVASVQSQNETKNPQKELEQEEFEKEKNEGNEPKQLNFSFVDFDSFFDPYEEQPQQELPFNDLDSIKRCLRHSIYSSPFLDQFDKNKEYANLETINSPEQLDEYVKAVALPLAFDNNLLRNIQEYIGENSPSAEKGEERQF